MSTDRQFNELLNEYLYHDLLMAEFIKRNYFMQKIKIDDSWKGGPMPLRFESSTATSVKYGGLTDESDIDSFTYLRSVVEGAKEVWGSMVWEGRDIREHDGRGALKVQTILKNLPDQIDRFLDYMKSTVTMNLLNGNFLTRLAEAGTATGEIRVRNIERLEMGQKIVIKAPSGTTVTGYIQLIDINRNSAAIVNGRGSVTRINLTGFVAGFTIHVDGSENDGNAFTSIIEQLDSANPNFFTLKKSAAPFLQAVNIDGGSTGIGMDSSNFLDKLFDCMTRAKQVGRGNPTHFLMSYKHLGVIKKILEAKAGAYRHIDTKVSPFNYEEVTIGGVKGNMVCVGLNEKDSDTIIGVDWKSIVFHTNEGFKKETSPDGLNYYTIRKSTGYRYICDIACYGEFVVTHPCYNVLIKNTDFADSVDSTIVGAVSPLVIQTNFTPGANIGGTEAAGGSAVLNAVKSFLGADGQQ